MSDRSGVPSTHPECPPEYAFIGNMPKSAFQRLDWKNKESGQMCFAPGGKLIPQGGSRVLNQNDKLVPVFIERKEFEARQQSPIAATTA